MSPIIPLTLVTNLVAFITRSLTPRSRTDRLEKIVGRTRQVIAAEGQTRIDAKRLKREKEWALIIHEHEVRQAALRRTSLESGPVIRPRKRSR